MGQNKNTYQMQNMNLSKNLIAMAENKYDCQTRKT